MANNEKRWSRYDTAQERVMRYVPDGVSDEECWETTGTRSPRGYGKTSWRNTHWRLHRLSYTAFHGAIPDGMIVMHSCDNPPCVNPAHLVLGTTQDNVDDRMEKGRWSPHNKVDDPTADLIRKDPRPAKECASDYGVHWSTVYSIRRK